VWLNADSKISFPSQFTGSERKILLEGEAYFEVAKNKEMPFIVESGGQRVEVLGTHFNISAYQDEGSIKTTLLEGSVRIAYGSRHPELVSGSRNRKAALQGWYPDLRQGGVVLKPNQQAILTGNKLDVILANIEQTMAWKNGMIVFEKQSLREVMRGLSRWYNVTVVYEPGVENILFTGSISRFKNISSILEIMALTGKFHFKIEGRRVTVMK
ncbi:MAG: FecR family protein, partial [Pedobacter sp.]